MQTWKGQKDIKTCDGGVKQVRADETDSSKPLVRVSGKSVCIFRGTVYDG